MYCCERHRVSDFHHVVPEAARGRRAASAQLPATGRVAREILTLPCYVEMEEGEIAAVAGAIRRLGEGVCVD